VTGKKIWERSPIERKDYFLTDNFYIPPWLRRKRMGTVPTSNTKLLSTNKFVRPKPKPKKAEKWRDKVALEADTAMLTRMGYTTKDIKKMSSQRRKEILDHVGEPEWYRKNSD
jgi:hypothetical protein